MTRDAASRLKTLRARLQDDVARARSRWAGSGEGRRPDAAAAERLAADGAARLEGARRALAERRRRRPAPSTSSPASSADALATRADAARTQLADVVSRARRRARERPRGGARPIAAAAVGVVAIAALLLLVQRCDEPPIPSEASCPACATCEEAPTCVPPIRIAKKPPPARRKERLPATAREALDVGDRGAPPWMEAFRRAVMVRSTVLAACFTGVERPGAVWWTARLDPVAGVASDGRLEPALGGAGPSSTQEQCLLRGLQETPYVLGPSAAADPDARRLRLLIEF